jgi:hypothetical protein
LPAADITRFARDFPKRYAFLAENAYAALFPLSRLAGTRLFEPRTSSSHFRRRREINRFPRSAGLCSAALRKDRRL